MTKIIFNFSDSYATPTNGALAFTPHRRHTAGNLEVLPNPFTVHLRDGQATVDLVPNPNDWVWMLTNILDGDLETTFFTVPDSDTTLQHTQLHTVNPSSLPKPWDNVEPQWWAEIKSYQALLGEVAARGEAAATKAEDAINEGQQYVTQTRDNAALARAYAEESRRQAYLAKEYADSIKPEEP